MSNDDAHLFWTTNEPRIRLQLRRGLNPATSRRDGGKPVLLLHGASANHGTFLIGDPGLAPWLCAHGFDLWLLDWRGSSLVAGDEANQTSLRRHPDAYNFNRAAAEDLPAAIWEMRKRGVNGPIGLLGHCMGSAVVAEAVALGSVTRADVDCVVHLALGLFYEAPIDSRLKSEERILEQLSVQIGEDAVLAIDPSIADNGGLSRPWPEDLTKLYDAWPTALRSHDEAKQDHVGALCNRLSFMYGMPYRHDNLVAAIHGAGSHQALLPHQFGAIPLRMYLHAARNLRQGHATFYPNPPDGRTDDEFVSENARAAFRELDKVTLVTGALNRLWHRDSIDRMHEWLCRGSSDSLRKFTKRIIPTYAHQDLLWGKASAGAVYPFLAEGLC